MLNARIMIKFCDSAVATEGGIWCPGAFAARLIDERLMIPCFSVDGYSGLLLVGMSEIPRAVRVQLRATH